MKQEHHKRNIESSLDIQNINILNELIEQLRLDETHATYKYILEQCSNESHTVKYLLKRVSTLENSIIEFNRSQSALETHFKVVQKEVNDYKQQFHYEDQEAKPIVKDLNNEFEDNKKDNATKVNNNKHEYKYKSD